jgi:hypothetical protein
MCLQHLGMRMSFDRGTQTRLLRAPLSLARLAKPAIRLSLRHSSRPRPADVTVSILFATAGVGVPRTFKDGSGLLVPQQAQCRAGNSTNRRGLLISRNAEPCASFRRQVVRVHIPWSAIAITFVGNLEAHRCGAFCLLEPTGACGRFDWSL